MTPKSRRSLPLGGYKLTQSPVYLVPCRRYNTVAQSIALVWSQTTRSDNGLQAGRSFAGAHGVVQLRIGIRSKGAAGITRPDSQPATHIRIQGDGASARDSGTNRVIVIGFTRALIGNQVGSQHSLVERETATVAADQFRKAQASCVPYCPGRICSALCFCFKRSHQEGCLHGWQPRRSLIVDVCTHRASSELITIPTRCNGCSRHVSAAPSPPHNDCCFRRESTATRAASDACLGSIMEFGSGVETVWICAGRIRPMCA